jgi:membrane-associated protease RseP (regulator of RpoE activity)
VSSDLPELPSASSSEFEETSESHQFREPNPTWREWALSAFLLLATLLTTSFAGLFYIMGNARFLDAVRAVLVRPHLLLLGFPFSIPLIIILLAHEMGHYIACRHYGIRCTPPYFIPAPISIAGTLGAFIKIKSPFLHKRALFDIGVAGPLAGFVFILPALWVGISFSRLIPKGAIQSGGISFGEPAVFRLAAMALLGYVPARQDMIASPIAMAAWFGLLATSLNLLPIWQLDGGHIAYAVFGRSWQKKISVAAVIGLVIVSFWGWPTPSYLLFSLLLLIIGARLRFYHPPTLYDEGKLGSGRTVVAVIALIILILSFIPVPVSIF